MTGKLALLIRLVAALTFAGFGIYSLVELGHSMAKAKAEFSFWLNAFLCFLLALIPIVMGYLMYRRRYHELCSVLAMPASMVVFFILSILPRHFGWHRALDWLATSMPLGLLAVFLSLLFLFGPFFAAAWFYRLCIRLANRYLPGSKPRQWPALNTATEKQ